MENIPKEQFLPAGDRFSALEETRPVPKGTGAWRRFRKNRSSVAAAVLLLLLGLFALVGPMLSPYNVASRDGYYKNALPKLDALSFLGWDGCMERSCAQAACDYYRGIGIESGRPAVKEITTRTKEDRKSTRLNSSHPTTSRMPSSA